MAKEPENFPNCKRKKGACCLCGQMEKTSDSAQTETMTLRAGYETFFGTDHIVSAAPSIRNVKNQKLTLILSLAS